MIQEKTIYTRLQNSKLLRKNALRSVCIMWDPPCKMTGDKPVFFVGVPGMAHISEVETYLQSRAVTPKA
jgi:hypothetical protein